MKGKPLEDREAEALFGAGWSSPDTMPTAETVEILAVRGRISRARRGRWPAMGGGSEMRRICCTGDRMAVAWRPIAKPS